MAKQNPPSGERSKVRLLFVDGEFAQGEIQAIAMAFARPTLPPRAPQKRLATPATDDNVLEAEREIEVEYEVEAPKETNGASASLPQSKTSRSKRTYPTPPTVEMDMASGGKSFKDFALEKDPKSQLDRYIVAAAWCHEYAKLESITASHVRTCYIAADWTFKVPDPLQPFRDLKKQGLGDLADGNFKLGHLGIGRAKEMKGA